MPPLYYAAACQTAFDCPAERRRRAGHDMRAHLRSEIHGYLGRTWLAPAGSAGHPLQGGDVRRRIAETQRRLEVGA